MILGFGTLDWCIVGVYILLAAVPGFLCRKYILGQADFLVAGRTLSVFLATATLTATEMGLITVMYMAEFSFRHGFAGIVIGLLAFSTTLFVGITGFIVRGLRESGVTTVAEYYEKRYSRGVRLLGGIVIAMAGILNYGIFLKVEAEFIRIITGIPDIEIRTTLPAGSGDDAADSALARTTASSPTATAASESAPAIAIAVAATTQAIDTQPVPVTIVAEGKTIHISSVKLVMVILVVIVLAYTLMGGMVSVALTDYIQFIILTLGMAGATWWVFNGANIGGFDGMVSAVKEYRGDYGFNPLVTGESAVGAAMGIGAVWIIWQLMHWLGTNTWQTQAFRTAATDSPSTARQMCILT